MIFNSHSNLVGQHAFLSASKYHWINYDDQKLEVAYLASMAARRGTELHDLASRLIRLGIKLPKAPTTLNLYVNDAIGFRMVPEQVLYFSENCFGTADAIAFRNDMLRIHDLKTGITKTSVTQIEIYAAMFCLEYGIKPVDIGMEFRIYQSDEVQIYAGDPDAITHIISRIIAADRAITEMKGDLV